MRLLAADTSTKSGSVALLEEERVVAEWTLQSDITHNRLLLKTIDYALQQAGWSLDDVEAFAVTTGPGSFTGLRIGLTTIKTLAWATGKPLVGVPSLDALALPLAFASMPVCALLDARRKELFFAFFEPDRQSGLLRRSPYHVGSPQKLATAITSTTLFCGDGWSLYGSVFQDMLGHLAVGAPPPFNLLRAGFVGELARRSLAAGVQDDPLTLAPLYVRLSEVEISMPHLLHDIPATELIQSTPS